VSTRSSLAYVTEGPVTVHLFHEGHDDEVHLEIRHGKSNALINVVVPKVLVDGVSAMLLRLEHQGTPDRIVRLVRGRPSDLVNIPSNITREAIAELRVAVRDGAGHDCGEWMDGGRCLLCDEPDATLEHS